tara:strand:+ start:362 stop:670 length:309 start_codon:yes stop_codon:yes gene_type:complete
MIGKLDADERVLSEKVDLGEQPIQLTPNMINEINELMAHTKKDGTYNWLTTDEYEIALAGTFAADKFIVIHNRSKKPWKPSAPHPNFDYEKGEFKNLTGDNA